MDFPVAQSLSWLFVAIAASALVIAFVPAVVVKAWQRRRLRRLCQGKLALTYDDGPDPLLTESLIQMLDRYGARATFFMVGFRAQRSPQMAQALADAGHELGCHGNMHVNSWRVWPWQAVRDIHDGYRALHPWVARTSPYRPAFGKLTLWTLFAVIFRGSPLRWWTADGLDTQPELPDPARVAHDIINAGGAVVLLHSHDRGLDRHRYVLQLTEELLIAARQRSVKICTLQELYEPEHTA